ncbi:DnaJ domain containing protein [Trema orientale]|uniref:DnaJ domain containing protein n=1 Tax=Trema orientale TaxID=63057 RepID=A0A2P5F6X3_TREOI|nr:DnaJ domain containing protein [Trema orientale]
MGSTSKRKKRHVEESSDDDSSPSEESSDYSKRSSKSSQRRHRHRSDGGSRREKERREKEGRRKRRRERKDRERKRRKLRNEDKNKNKKKRDYESDSYEESESGSSSNDGDSEPEQRRVQPQVVLQDLLKAFPNVVNDLKQLLQMIDNGQAVDINGVSERSLVKHLKKLFLSLSLKENSDNVFTLPSNVHPTLEVVGPLLHTSTDLKAEEHDHSVLLDDTNTAPGSERGQEINSNNVARPEDDSVGPKRRIIGPAMPSAELLAAAAKLTEAQAELREAELDEDTGLFIGPAPLAMVAEAASANEAERFEEVTRIMSIEADCPYDILGINQNRAADNIKKRYWKISLLVHPDKCSHPQANQAFAKLNKAFNELQDPEKRKALDEKIKLKEEQEKFKIELRAMREAAQWRRSQGISMEGDDELLAEMDVKVAPQREEWMTTLPPERKPGGMPMHSTSFSKNTKEGRGDTSVWTDTPSDRAQKAKMNFLEAYNEAAALASNEVQKSSEADLVDKYNKEKRSKSLVQKHQEKAASHSKKKSTKQQLEKEEWVGQHPWKPWDREKDLVAGRLSVKLDSENMAEGLTSRFSSGSFQRNFL